MLHLHVKNKRKPSLCDCEQRSHKPCEQHTLVTYSDNSRRIAYHTRIETCTKNMVTVTAGTSSAPQRCELTPGYVCPQFHACFKHCGPERENLGVGASRLLSMSSAALRTRHDLTRAVRATFWSSQPLEVGHTQPVSADVTRSRELRIA